MIKFQGTRDGRTFLGIGLSRENVKRLLEDKPIHFNAEQMGLASIAVQEVLIFVGDTEASMRRDLEDRGLLEGTRIIEEPTMKQ